MSKVLTGPQGIISVKDQYGKEYTIGRCRQIKVSSDFQRDSVTGIGTVYASELPLVRWTGTVSVDSYAIIATKAILNAFDMSVQDVDKFFRFLLFEQGINLTMKSVRPVSYFHI